MVQYEKSKYFYAAESRLPSGQGILPAMSSSIDQKY